MARDLKLLKFPTFPGSDSRTACCLKTVMKTLDEGDNLDLVLASLVNYSSELDTDEYFELAQMHLKLFEALFWWREFNEES